MNFDQIKQALNLQIQQVITGKTEQNSIDPTDVGSMMTSIVDAITPFLNHVINFTASGLAPISSFGTDDDVHFQIGTSFTVWQKVAGAWIQKGNVAFGITVPNGNGTVQSSVNGMLVTSSSGVWWINNSQYAKATQTQFTIPAQHPTLPRIDAVFGNNIGTGQLTYQQGTAADTPLEPSTPADNVMITYIYVPSVASGQSPYIANTNSGSGSGNANPLVLSGGSAEPIGGNDNDIYIRSESSGVVTFYQKQSGAWVIIQTFNTSGGGSSVSQFDRDDLLGSDETGYYLPYILTDGESLLTMLIKYTDSTPTESKFPQYSGSDGAITGFITKSNVDYIKVWATG